MSECVVMGLGGKSEEFIYLGGAEFDWQTRTRLCGDNNKFSYFSIQQTFDIPIEISEVYMYINANLKCSANQAPADVSCIMDANDSNTIICNFGDVKNDYIRRSGAIPFFLNTINGVFYRLDGYSQKMLSKTVRLQLSSNYYISDFYAEAGSFLTVKFFGKQYNFT